MAVEEAKDRQVGPGMMRGIEMAGNWELRMAKVGKAERSHW